MENLTKRSFKSAPYKRFGISGFEFDPKATEVAILDRTGRPIWKNAREQENSPIRWTGLNSAGQTVETGDYICKIVYSDDKVAYLPFVFMKHA